MLRRFSASGSVFCSLLLMTAGFAVLRATYDRASLFGPAQPAGARPTAAGLTVFLYYQDIEKAVSFYRGILGLRAVVDKSPIHVFEITPTTSVGLVDAKTARGAANRPSVNKPLTVTFVVDDVDAWYKYLLERGVTIARPPRDSANLNVRFFIFNDPEGYELEVMSWRQSP